MMPRARSALYVASCSSSLKVRSDGGTAGLQELCEVGWCDVAFPDVFEQVHARVGVTAVGELAADHVPGPPNPPAQPRSEEHTSELQSHSDLVCRLLLEKKKK